MPPLIATGVFTAAILGLFIIERDHEVRTSKALWIPVAWILAATLVSRWLPWTTETSVEALEGNPAETTIFTGLLAIGTMVLVHRRREVLTLLRKNKPILVYFSYCALSTLWADYPDVAFKRWIKSLGDLVIVIIILTDPARTSGVKRFVAWCGYLLLPTSFLVVRYYPDLGVRYLKSTGRQSVTGITNDKNMLGLVCLLFGLGFLSRVLHTIRNKRRFVSNRPQVAQGVIYAITHWLYLRVYSNRRIIADGLVLAMTLWLFWRVNSMTALACFLAASCVIVATALPALARRRAIIHLIVATLVGVSALVLFVGPGAGLVEIFGRDQNLTGRTELWNEILAMTENQLLGVGFESFWTGPRLDEIWTRYWSHPAEAHNGYIEVILNLGWVGVALLALVILTGYRNVISALRWDREVGGLRLAYFLVGLMYSFTEAGFRLLNPAWIFFLLSTLAHPETSGTKRLFRGTR